MPSLPRRRVVVPLVASVLLTPALIASGGLPAAGLSGPQVAAPMQGGSGAVSTDLLEAEDQNGTSTTMVAGDEVVASLERTATDDFQMVGITWAGGADPATLTAEVRTRADGTWSAWEELGVEDAAEPGARAGTEPLWVGDADGVAARVLSADGTSPDDVQVAVIDSPVRSGDAAVAAAGGDVSLDSSALSAEPASIGVRAAAPQPTIVSRATWGAKTATCGYANNKAQLGAVLHHTAGSNSYTQAQSASVVRATQSYHKDRLGWCDLGYNFLVDKYGTIYEGRVGGTTRMVRGAHAGFTQSNEQMVGVSMMGNYDTVALTSPLKSSVAALIAWRFNLLRTPATGTVRVDGKTVNRIAGHRDLKATACPGRYGYAWLNQTGSGGLRGMVAARTAGGGTTSPTPGTPPPSAPRLTGTILSTYTKYRSHLGANTSAIANAKQGYTYANFTNGRVYAKGTQGYALWGAIDKAHRAAKGTSGVMGVPRGSVTAKNGGWFVTMSGGRIYSRGASSWLSWGRVDAKHRALKGTSGRLGFPTRSVYSTKKGNQKATYVGGSISYNPKTRKYSVTYR